MSDILSGPTSAHTGVTKISWYAMTYSGHFINRGLAWQAAGLHLKQALHILWCLITHPRAEEVDP